MLAAKTRNEWQRHSSFLGNFHSLDPGSNKNLPLKADPRSVGGVSLRQHAR